MNDTINYYNKNAKEYFDSTVSADMKDCYDRFLKHLKKGQHILDVGCGSGRDSKTFIDLGFNVTSIDGSIELCKLAEEYIGQPVYCKDFKDIDYKEEFDAIWACASLLHVSKDDINDVIHKLYNSLKQEGIIYASFKYGNEERIHQTRYFNDVNEDIIKILFNEFTIKEIWLSDDVRNDRDDRWINIIAKK